MLRLVPDAYIAEVKSKLGEFDNRLSHTSFVDPKAVSMIEGVKGEAQKF